MVVEKINFEFCYAILDPGTTSTSTVEQEYSSSLGLSFEFSVGISVGFARLNASWGLARLTDI